MGTILLLLLVMLGCSSTSAPEEEPQQVRYGRISGVVYLRGSAQPLGDVEVTVAGRSDTTTDDGAYEIDSIPEGSHSLRASHSDYELYEQVVQIVGNTRQDIELTIAIESGALRGRVSHPIYGPVSSARVSVAGLFAYSDLEGSYEILDVPVGFQVVTCTHPGSYHDRTDSLYISGADNEFDIILLRTVERGKRISQDATVRMHGDSPFYATDSTSGRWPIITARHEYSGQTFIKSRIVMSLPPIPPEVQVSELDAATLKLNISSTLSAVSAHGLWVPLTLVVRRVLSPWFEDTVTWITAPEVDTDSASIIATVKPPQTGSFEIDVLKMYLHDREPDFGIRLALRSDEANALRTKMIEIYSSEARDSTKGPMVIFRYTH